MIVVGLTGNYGMGKSTVAGMFRDLGAITIDTDKIVQELLLDTNVIHEIKKAFGDDVAVNGVLNKRMLSDIAFGTPSARIALENILHPRVFRKTDEEAAKIKDKTIFPIVIIEATVIFERGYQGRFDRIVTVFTSEETATARLSEKGISAENAKKRLDSQFPIQKKISGSDYIIDNSNTRESTMRQVEHIYQELLTAEKRHGNN